MANFIEIKGLSHVYQNGEEERTALAGIDLTICAGEFVAVLGTNGSGKSTLAKHLNALLLPTAGNCKIAGFDTRNETDLWKIRQMVGMVFQNPDNQIVATVVEEDVAFGPENLGVPSDEIRVRVDESLRAVGMEAYRHHAPHLLSGGQKQRVAIAGALAMRTRCLVLDEPTAMLDPQGRFEVLETVRSLHRTAGITVVYITHFMEEALAADRVVVMKHGRIYAQATPREIFTQVEALQRLGLEVPLAAQVAHLLRQKGLRLPADIMTDIELAVALCR